MYFLFKSLGTLHVLEDGRGGGGRSPESKLTTMVVSFIT